MRTKIKHSPLINLRILILNDLNLGIVLDKLGYDLLEGAFFRLFRVFIII